jgi:hypothetical protein
MSTTENLVAVPSITSHYFTAGREYRVLRREAYVLIVRCDRGHERVISQESGARCAHLPPLDAPRHFPSSLLGHFTITAKKG